MKIGFDAKRYYHNNTGLGNYSRNIVGGLMKQFPENEYMLYDEKSFNRTFRLGSKAKKDGCDIFHGLSNELPIDCKVPSICTIHDVCWRTYPEMYHLADRYIYDWKYGSSCRRADKIVAISESTKRDIMRIYGIAEEKIEIVYQPVGKEYYIPCEKKGLSAEKISELECIPDDYILYVGSINSRKNLLGAVKALAMIPEENRPFLLIVGNGREYRREVETFIYQNKLEEYTRIATNIHDNSILKKLYANAKAFIYPSFYEGFGLPVVEAALQFTPVITSTLSSLPEAAGPDACLVDPYANDAEEQMAQYIERLCSDRQYHDDVATKMEAYARQMFDPNTLTDRLMNVYQSCL